MTCFLSRLILAVLVVPLVEAELSYSVVKSILVEGSFRKCCIAHGMPEECAKQLCSYGHRSIAKQAVCQHVEKCAIYTGEWLHCAMDGNEVLDCVEEYRRKRYPVSDFCLSTFANGTSPSLNYVFVNGDKSNDCLKRIRLFNYCWKRNINGTTHQNVCLEPGPDCPTFDHTLSDDGRLLYDLYVFFLTRGCVEEDQDETSNHERQKRSYYDFDFY